MARPAYLLLNLPQALHIAVHVAAPQHDAPIDHKVAALGRINAGIDNARPMVCCDIEMQ